MPNWCNNVIKITGEKKHIDAFMKYIKKNGGKFEFQMFAPYPEEYQKLDDIYFKAKEDHEPTLPKSGYEQGGASWINRNWGTKWNVVKDDVSFSRKNAKTFVVFFLTAWSPAEPIAKAISKMFPELLVRIDYSEPGMQFEGHAVYKNDVELEAERLENVDVDEDFDDEEFDEDLDEEDDEDDEDEDDEDDDMDDDDD